MLNLIDEHTRECLTIHVRRRIGSRHVIEVLADAMIEHGIPEHIRSDNGPEFVAKELRRWLARIGAKTLYIEPGSPWENGYCESFNSKLRDEFLNGEIFYSLRELEVLAERWRVYYNTRRPHSSLGYRPPAPAAWLMENNKGMQKWKPLRASHFPIPPTATDLLTRPLRYTNNLTGTKHRAGHAPLRVCGQRDFEVDFPIVHDDVAVLNGYLRSPCGTPDAIHVAALRTGQAAIEQNH